MGRLADRAYKLALISHLNSVHAHYHIPDIYSGCLRGIADVRHNGTVSLGQVERIGDVRGDRLNTNTNGSEAGLTIFTNLTEQEDKVIRRHGKVKPNRTAVYFDQGDIKLLSFPK
jgi:hypothetical protein